MYLMMEVSNGMWIAGTMLCRSFDGCTNNQMLNWPMRVQKHYIALFFIGQCQNWMFTWLSSDLQSTITIFEFVLLLNSILLQMLLLCSRVSFTLLCWWWSTSPCKHSWLEYLWRTRSNFSSLLLATTYFSQLTVDLVMLVMHTHLLTCSITSLALALWYSISIFIIKPNLKMVCHIWYT